MGLPVDSSGPGRSAYDGPSDGLKKPLQRQESDDFQLLIDVLRQCTDERGDAIDTFLKKSCSAYIVSYSSATHEDDCHDNTQARVILQKIFAENPEFFKRELERLKQRENVGEESNYCAKVQEMAWKATEGVESAEVCDSLDKSTGKLEMGWLTSEKLVQKPSEMLDSEISGKCCPVQEEGVEKWKDEEVVESVAQQGVLQPDEKAEGVTEKWQEERVESEKHFLVEDVKDGENLKVGMDVEEEEQAEAKQKEAGTQSMQVESQEAYKKENTAPKKKRRKRKGKQPNGLSTPEAESGHHEKAQVGLKLDQDEKILKSSKKKRRGRKKRGNHGVEKTDTSRQQKDFSNTESVLKKAAVKVKMATNHGNSNDQGKGGQAKGDHGGKTQGCAGASADGGNRATQPTSGNGRNDDDDDDDERRKPRSSDPSKKPDCHEQARRKKKKPPSKEKPRGSRSPSPRPCGPEAMDWEPTGARPKTRPRGGLRKNDGSSSKAPPVSLRKLQGEMQALSLGNRRRGGPAGDAGHNKHLAAFLSEELSRPEEPMPRTRQNHQAARRWFLDYGFQAHRDVAQSLPSQMRERGPSTRQDDPHTPPSLGINPRAGASREVPVVGGLAVEALIADEALQPPEGAPGVRHGGPRDVRVLAERIGRLRGLDPAELRGRHEGVLLDENLTPVNGQYREGREYTKLDCIGKGAFGDVFLMQDRATCKRVVGKRVAVNVFVPSEATLWCELDHPGIVRFLGLLITDEWVVFLSSYQPGSRTLQELIDQSVLGQGQAVLITRQLVLALEYLHSTRYRIVHKDIKPHNILVLPGDRVQLIDFGLAYQLTTPEHRDEALMGTDCYMAPEIAVSGPYDARVDIWSAACTLICMISGHPPWAQRFNGVGVKIFIIGNNPPPLEDIPSNTDPRVCHFLEQTLKKDFQERPTATQALEILSHIPAEELYNTLVIECEDPEPEPMNIPNELPDDAFADPLTPWTPRGPDFRPFQRPSPQPRQPAQDMSLSGLLIPRDEEPRKDQQVEEEDMYGPPAVQNNWATSSFMLDSANHPSGLSEESNSFELPSSSGRSMEECHSWQTAHDIMFKGGEMLSAEDPPQDEPDVGGTVGVVAGTSGVLSTSPGHSGDETSLTDTIQSTSTAVSGGIVAVVSIEGLEPLRMRLRPDFDARELLQVIMELPDFKNTKLASKTIQLCWKDTGEVLELDHMFGRGEHQLHVVAMEAPGEGYWPMDIDG